MQNPAIDADKPIDEHQNLINALEDMQRRALGLILDMSGQSTALRAKAMQEVHVGVGQIIQDVSDKQPLSAIKQRALELRFELEGLNVIKEDIVRLVELEESKCS